VPRSGLGRPRADAFGGQTCTRWYSIDAVVKQLVT